MAGSLKTIIKTKNIRNRVLYTIVLLLISRIGTVIPVPGIDALVLSNYFKSLAAVNSPNVGFTEYLNFFSGGAFSNFSILMLGVMPYISAEIIIQILMVIIPTLKEMAKEPSGARKLQKYTRYGTILVCFLQSVLVTIYAKSLPVNVITIENKALFTAIAMFSCTAGTMFLIWLGERITQNGVGNGISLLIYAGIIARVPSGVFRLVECVKDGSIYLISAVSVLLVFLFVITLCIFEEQGVRQISVQYAKRVVGNKMYGGQSAFIPLKINPSGVIPVIFASAIITFPLQIATTLGPNVAWLHSFAAWLNPLKVPYLIIYTVLIVLFAFFYTQVTLNPIEMSKQIRENGGSIPGIRVEKTEEYLTEVLNRIVLPGSLFLAFIALIPSLLQMLLKFPGDVAILFGGTSLLIVVGVTLDTMRQLEGLMKTYGHSGLLDGKTKRRNF